MQSHDADLEFIELRSKLDSLLAQEERFWRQRAKVFWMRDGDMNTKFFHATATSRKQKNKISKLHDEEGNPETRRLDFAS